jgi:hypothetical protein
LLEVERGGVVHAAELDEREEHALH